MSILSSVLRTAFLVSLPIVFGAAATASADWTAYVVGHIGIATGGAEVTVPNTQPPPDFRVGSDRDSSPMLSGAVGLEIPMDELMAWQLPYGLELPDWPVRSEIEFAGLRDFEYRTLVNPSAVAPDDIYLTSSTSWAMMVNAWFDVPSTILTRPLAWTFQTRKASVRRVLEPITFYVGPGVGMSRIKLDAVSTLNQQAKGKDIKFAWQIGTGLGYQLTPFVNVDLGYRYFKAKEVSPTVTDGVNPAPGAYRLNEHIHELRAGLRVNVYSFMSPWSRLE